LAEYVANYSDYINEVEDGLNIPSGEEYSEDEKMYSEDESDFINGGEATPINASLGYDSP